MAADKAQGMSQWHRGTQECVNGNLRLRQSPAGTLTGQSARQHHPLVILEDTTAKISVSVFGLARDPQWIQYFMLLVSRENVVTPILVIFSFFFHY